MADDMGSAPGPTDRVGFRDIYRAVEGSEARIMARLDDLATNFTGGIADHETRLRVIEHSGSAAALSALEKAGKVEARVTVVEGKVDGFIVREKGIFSTLNAQRSILVTAGVVLALAISVLNLIERLA